MNHECDVCDGTGIETDSDGLPVECHLCESDYQVGECTAGIDACGSGQQVALGALHATPHLPPMKRLMTALAVAEALNAGVRGPFDIRCLGCNDVAEAAE